jgi:nucleotide-binding universal stress UspA family protein
METILIATDFSPAAKNATEYGVRLAKYFNASIILVNAYPLPPSDYEMGFAVEMSNALRDTADEGLQRVEEEIAARHQRDFHITKVAEMGFPAEVIMRAAEKYNADLVVMGIVGEAGALKEHLIGSAAVHVARSSAVPTLIIPSGVAYHPVRKIAFACDLDKTEESYAVYITKYFARLFDAELEIVNVEEPDEEMSNEKARSSLFIEKKLATLPHRTVFATASDTAEGLKTYLQAHPCDLLITNPKKHSFFHNLFHESTTKKLAFHLSVPVLAIH